MSRQSGVVGTDPIFAFKASFRNILNFNIIWFVLSLFLILVIFQFSPPLAESNALLFYPSITFSEPLTTSGWTILATAIIFFTTSLVLGFFRIRYGFIFGAISVTMFAMFFFTGTFIMFRTII